MSNQTDLDLSVVILSFNSANYINRCLDSVIESAAAVSLSFEIYIIDNGSQDGSVNILNQYKAKHPDQIHLKLFEHNTGTTVSRNYGLSRAQGRHILVLDSDAYINPEAIKHLIKELNNDHSLGMIVPKVIYSSGNFQKSTDVFPTLHNKFLRFFFLKNTEQKEHNQQPTVPVEIDYAISAFWLFPRRIIDEVGLLDENIFYSPEDVDYCIRIRKHGYRIMYDPSVTIIHDAQEISRKKLNKFFFSHLKGLFYLFNKHNYGIIRKSPIR